MFSTPIVYNIFIRRELIEKVFSRIREIKPQVFYLVSDNGRDDDEKIKVRQNREFIEKSIDWDCKLIKLYTNKNIGVFNIYDYSLSNVFKNEDFCIFLEEDILPEIDFFYFTDELLKKYKDDDSISLITGMNPLIHYPLDQSPSYFFVNGSVNIWGHGIWKRTYQKFIRDFSIDNVDSYSKELIRDRLELIGNIHWFKVFEDSTSRVTSMMEKDLLGLSPQILYNSLFIVPSVNLTSNIGASVDSEHSGPLSTLPKRWRESYFQQTSKLFFPLVHPRFKIADSIYYKMYYKRFKRIGKLRFFLEKVERIFRYLIFMGIKPTLKKVKSKYNKIK
jgi:hypothetical protein